jgi:cytochrome P450
MTGAATAAAWPFPGRAYFKWLRTAPRLERAINDWIDEIRGEPNPKNIFSVLVNNPDEKGEPPSKKVIGGILSFTFGAAYETCQNALTWTLVLLTQHPKIAVALTEEIDSAVGSGPGWLDELGKLPLLDGVIREGMRLFPPVPMIFRRSRAETELGAVRIPARMRVLTSGYLINRDPALYSQPRKFMPERWLNLNLSPFEYPVFGGGGRMCPGALFSDQMLKIALATILSSHRVELAHPARIDHRTAITLKPYPGVQIVLREKAAASASPSPAPYGSIHELVDLPAAG